MYKAMKTYYEVGFKGPMREDHVPTVAGDSNDHPEYSELGNAVCDRLHKRIDRGCRQRGIRVLS